MKVAVNSNTSMTWLLLIYNGKNLFFKKFTKSLQVKVKAILGSAELWPFVSLATVLKRNLGLFVFSSVSDE